VTSLAVEASLQGPEGHFARRGALDYGPAVPAGGPLPPEQQPRSERYARRAKRSDLCSPAAVGETPGALAGPFDACDRHSRWRRACERALRRAAAAAGAAGRPDPDSRERGRRQSTGPAAAHRQLSAAARRAGDARPRSRRRSRRRRRPLARGRSSLRAARRRRVRAIRLRRCAPRAAGSGRLQPRRGRGAAGNRVHGLRERVRAWR